MRNKLSRASIILSRGFLIVILQLSLSSCQVLWAKHLKITNAHRINFVEHVVKAPGETLAKICRYYTGNTKQLRKIMAANPKLNAYKLSIGTTVLIPSNILKAEMRSLMVLQTPVPPVKTPLPVATKKVHSSTNASKEVLPDSLGQKFQEVLEAEKTPKFQAKIVDPFSVKTPQSEPEYVPQASDNEEAEIVEPTIAPKVIATPVDSLAVEEQHLKDQYKDIMKGMD